MLRRLLPVLFILFSVDVVGGFTFLAAAQAYNRSLAPPEGADAAVVFFGDFGRHFGLDADTFRRVEHAVGLYRGGLVHHVLAVGGQRDGVRPSGALRMERALVALGVPPEAVLRDRGSFDTVSNWKAADRIVHAHGWRRVILVSSPLHLYRIRRIARDPALELTASASSRIARDLHDGPLGTWQAIHHEWLGWLSLTLLPRERQQAWTRRWRNLVGQSPTMPVGRASHEQPWPTS
jgi:uncharacterized SAM-binding protein YcdF (DUF218 family)